MEVSRSTVAVRTRCDTSGDRITMREAGKRYRINATAWQGVVTKEFFEALCGRGACAFAIRAAPLQGRGAAGTPSLA
jgi:hypothetical protein